MSWVDYCVGQMLKELEALGHKNDTVIALVGDHGWQLGEHNIWGKVISPPPPFPPPLFATMRAHHFRHNPGTPRPTHAPQRQLTLARNRSTPISSSAHACR